MSLFLLQYFTVTVFSFFLLTKQGVGAQECSDSVTQLIAGTENIITVPCISEELVLTDEFRDQSHLAIPTNCTLNSTMYLGLNRTNTAPKLKLTFVCDRLEDNKCYTFKVFPAAEDQKLVSDTVACYPPPRYGRGFNSSLPFASQSAGADSPSLSGLNGAGVSAPPPGLNGGTPTSPSGLNATGTSAPPPGLNGAGTSASPPGLNGAGTSAPTSASTFQSTTAASVAAASPTPDAASTATGATLSSPLAMGESQGAQSQACTCSN